jgi:hypothetical protein
VTGARVRPAVRAAGIALAASLAAAALAYDARATADEPKRTLLLAIALVGLGLIVARGSARGPARGGEGPAGSKRADPNENDVRASDAWLAAAGLLALACVSALRGIPSGALELGTWVGAFGAGLAAARLGRAPAESAARVVAVLAGGGASLASVVAYACGGRGFALHGGQGNPNWLGLLVCVSLPLAVEAAGRAATDAAAGLRRVRLIALAAIVLVQAAGLVLSHSRVAWCATAAAAIVLAVAPRRADAGRSRGWHWGRTARIAVAGVALVAFGFGVLEHAAASFSHGSALFEHAGPISDDVPAGISLVGRLHIWRCSLSAAEGALPFGAGLGRFAHRFLDAQGETLAGLTPAAAARRFVNATTAHDEPLDLAVEAGPIAALLFVAFVSLGVRDALRGRWTAGAAALTAFGVAALGDSPLHQPAVAVVVALVAAGLPARRPLRTRGAGPRFVAASAGVATFALTAILLAASVRAWLATRAQTAALDRVGPARVAALTRSLAIDPTSGETLLDLGLAELALGDADRALAHLDRSRVLLGNLGTDVARGHAELARGDPQAAARAFQAALARHPGLVRARTGLAEALRRERRYDDAEHEADIARSLAPGDPVVRDLIDRIHEARMDDAASDAAVRAP